MPVTCWRSAVAVAVSATAAVVLAWSTVALAEGVPVVDVALESGGSGSSALAGGLVVPEVQLLDEDQQSRDAQEAMRRSPAAFDAREASQTAFEHLGARGAKELAEQAFPKLIQEPAGGLSQLPPQARVLKYTSDRVAQLALAGGKRAVLETVAPIALQTSPGHHKPIDLRLSEAGGVFRPVSSPVAVQIPRHLNDGIQVSRVGVSVTPIDSDGSALGGSPGEIAGASVIYATLSPTRTRS